jgi:hypothetical protein
VGWKEVKRSDRKKVRGGIKKGNKWDRKKFIGGIEGGKEVG